MLRILVFAISFAGGFLITPAQSFAQNRSAQNSPIEIKKIEALGRIRRIDILWHESVDKNSWLTPLTYEVQRAETASGPFEKINADPLELPMHSDFFFEEDKTYFYRVRSMVTTSLRGESKTAYSKWSQTVSATSTAYNREQFLTEIQEAGFRYFYHHAHPVSGLALEGAPHRKKNSVAAGASGMGMFNLVVGVKRKFITREQAAERILKMLTFLSDKAERHHGVFSHWLDGTTGKLQRFSKNDDGVDLVETAFLAQGFLLAREAFNADNETEKKIRKLADTLWREIEWDFFVRSGSGDEKYLAWHWSPTHGFDKTIPIRGFNECQIVYLLALVSPTHPIDDDVYKSGWHSGKFKKRTHFSEELELGAGKGGPLFFVHYSYLGLDPRTISYNGRSYFDHFVQICEAQKKYALSRQAEYKSYARMWGITASMGPDGYSSRSPNKGDDGTLAPTAALSSWPYVPEHAFDCAVEMYRDGKKLWGPFGFYDAFNFEQQWVANAYLGIDVGPIAPMIENSRSELCWEIMNRASEIAELKDKLRHREK